MSDLNVRTVLKRLQPMGVPFIYEGLRYSLRLDVQAPAGSIFCTVVDKGAVPEILHILDGTNILCSLEGTRIKRLVLPATVREICAGAVRNNTHLESVWIAQGSQLKLIENLAFKGCTNLERINLQAACRLTTIGRQAFFGCENLREVRLSASVKEVQEDAFSMCKGLQKFTAVPETNLHMSVWEWLTFFSHCSFKRE